MSERRGSYTSYSIASAIVWALILSVLGVLGDRDKLRKVLPVCGGWWIGWTSTLAGGMWSRREQPGCRGSGGCRPWW